MYCKTFQNKKKVLSDRTLSHIATTESTMKVLGYCITNSTPFGCASTITMHVKWAGCTLQCHDTTFVSLIYLAEITTHTTIWNRYLYLKLYESCFILNKVLLHIISNTINAPILLFYLVPSLGCRF